MTANTPMLSSCTLFCGVILLEPGPLSTQSTELRPWLARLQDSSSFLQYLGKSYYRNFLVNIAPEAVSSEGAQNRHFTLSHFHSPKEAAIVVQGKSISCTIPYFDIFLFPDHVAIFTFRVNLHDADANYTAVSNLISHMRQPGSILSIDGNHHTVKEFITQSLPPVIRLRKDWDQYMPQLKSYTVINDFSAARFSEELDRTLYELSHVIPIGASRESAVAPTPEYLKQVLSNAISVYDNWKAISLFDTFTRISCSYPDQFKSWEHEYFLIYVHALYTKYQLYSFNSRLNDIATITRNTKKLRSRFIAFVNDYHLAYISYKFLPNLIYEKISQSLEIQKELDRMELKLERIHQAYGERKSQQINQLLLVLSLMSILSVVTDLSAWLIQMGLPSEVVYSPVVPISMVGAILLAGFWIYKRRVG